MKSLDTINIGTVGLNVGNIQAYQSAIKGLSAEQAVFALSTKGANAAQIEEIMTTETATLAKGTYTQADVQAALAKHGLATASTILTVEQQKEITNSSLLSAEKMAEMASVLGLTTAENGSLVSKKALNAEMVKQQLESIGIVGATQAQIMSMLGLTTAETGAVKGTNLLTASFAKLCAVISAHPIGALITAVGALAVGVVSAVNASNKAKEETRQTAIELTNTYNQEQSSLDSQIEKYKELKETLEKGNLSTDETRSTKEQLLEIQQSLIDSYGNEVSNIDLVNGKYREQLGLLSELTKEKAQDYVTENRDVFEDAKEALKEVRKFELGTVTSWSSYVPKTEDQERLLDFIKAYSDLLELTPVGGSYGSTYTTAMTLSLKANTEDADNIMHQFAADLEQYINENNIDVDVSVLLENSIPEQLRNTWTDELKEYKEIYDEFIKAEIIRDDTLRPLYQQSIQAVEDYNNALSSSEGVEEAKANLDSVQQSVHNATGELEGSQEIFDRIYEEINKNAEAAYNLNQSFKNDETVKGYAEQLRGLNDIDLKAINFEDNVESPGEKAFGALIDILGLSKDEVQNLIDKLAELGYVQGEVKSDTFDSETDNLSITQTVDQINTQLRSAFDSLQSAYQDIFTPDEDTGEKLFSLDDVDISTFESIRSELEKLGEIDGINVDYSQFEDFVSVLSNTPSTAEEVQEQFNKLATDIIYTSDCTNMSAETFDLLAKSLSEMGVTNAYEVLEKIRNAQEELVALGYDVANITTKEASGLIELGSVSAETAEYLRMYLVQKELTQNPLSTLEDVTSLENLCNALGVTGQLYEYITALKRAFDAKERGAVSAGLDESIEAIQAKIKELSNGAFDFGFNFDGLGNNNPSGKSPSSSTKDTAETFDWIEQAIENVEKEIKELDEIANSSYSTFSQKNEALAQEIGKVSDEIGLQQQAYEEYMRKADSVGLSDHYKQLVQSGAVNIEDISDKNLQDLISGYQKWYDKAQNVSDAVRELKTDMKDLYVSAYELQTDNLKDRLDSDSITQKQYLESLKTAYEQFYANIEDFAEQYHEAVLDYLAEEKDYLNSVAGAAASLADTEIDQIREDADAQEDIIQKQIDLLEAKKKPLQDELDALEDKAKRENLILNLQKAQYELARAENQRTKLVYTSEKGMVYTADPATVRDAQKDVDDAKLEIQKQSIQDQIDALDDEINRYNDLIDQINNAADARIDALEKIKNKWQEVIDRQEHAKNVSLLTGEFGAGAISKILTGNDDDLLMQWKNSYINTLAGIDMESRGCIRDLTEQIALLYGVDLSPLQSQFMGVKDSVNGMTDSLGRAASAIGSGMNVPNYNADNADTEDNNAPNSPTNLTDSITGVGIAANQSLPNVTSNMDNIAETAANAALGVSSVTDAINNIPESKDVTISVHTVGVGSVSGGLSSEVSQIAYSEAGNAYAKGTRRAEKGLAIIGEEKPEAIVTNDDKVILADTPALVNMEGGETVYNGDETERMLNALKNPPLLANSLDADKTWQERMQRQTISDWYQNHVAGVNMNGYHMPGKYAGMISSAADSVTNNAPSYVLNGGVNVTCTGVTSQEVARQVGKEIEKTFFGMNTKAYQKANITR